MNNPTPSTPQLKQCYACKAQKPLTDFHASKRSPDGREGVCKPCRAKRRKAGPPPLPPAGFKRCTKCREVKAATPENFYNNKRTSDKLCPQCITCSRAYHAATREQRSAYRKIYYRANQEKLRAYALEYKAANRERVNQVIRKWARANRERVYQKNRNYYIRKAVAEGTHTAADVRRQYEAQRGKCYYCGCELGDNYHEDHVTPLSRGGSDGPENIVVACGPCNLAKGTKLPHEWEGTNRLL